MRVHEFIHEFDQRVLTGGVVLNGLNLRIWTQAMPGMSWQHYQAQRDELKVLVNKTEADPAAICEAVAKLPFVNSVQCEHCIIHRDWP